MNLLYDPWLPVIRRNGEKEKIAIWQLLSKYSENPVIDIEAPRPDFRNAIYQLLIGIVQVSAMPKNEKEWRKLFEEPYGEAAFKDKVLKYKDCFEIDTDGPAFMQDYKLTEPKQMNLTKIFLDSPSDNAIKHNAAHFVKEGQMFAICPYWASVALYAMQTFTAGIGKGHRVGLRGGGPLTAMLILRNATTLWKNIWFNVLSEEYLLLIPGDAFKKSKDHIFPWMGPTKTSKKNEGLFPRVYLSFCKFGGCLKA